MKKSTKTSAGLKNKSPEKISTDNLLLFLNLNVLEKYCEKTFDLYAGMLMHKTKHWQKAPTNQVLQF